MKDDADLRAPQIGPGLRVSNGIALPKNATGNREPDAAQQKDESRLAASARADNGDEVAFANVEADIFQRDDAPLIEAVADVIEGN